MSEKDQEQLNLAIEKFGITAAANQLGVARNTVYNWVSKGNMPLNKLLALRDLGVDVSCILNTKKNSIAQINEQINTYQTEFAEIQHYNVQAAAGSGRLATEEETLKPLSFRRDWLAKRHLTPANLAIVSVSGDSMEPYLKDEDLVLVDRSQITITSGKTYVLRLDGHLLVKNLQLLPHGLVQVASFNPGFPPYQVDLSDESLDMAVIGRVVASMHEW